MNLEKIIPVDESKRGKIEFVIGMKRWRRIRESKLITSEHFPEYVIKMTKRNYIHINN